MAENKNKSGQNEQATPENQIKDAKPKQRSGTLTPMMQQYMDIKEEHPDCLLFFRLGDFYELFFDDAIIASRELEIALTGRNCGMEERAPMCGVPFHSVDAYLKRLVEKGYKVAICEQLTDPKESEGLVERGIARIVTPGTIIEETMLESDQNNFIASIAMQGGECGFAYADISTGEFALTAFRDKNQSAILDELSRINPSEVIVNKAFVEKNPEWIEELRTQYYISEYFEWAFAFNTAERNLCSHLSVQTLSGYGCDEMTSGVSAAGALLAYINETQNNALSQINRIITYQRQTNMILDATTRRNLELVETIRGGSNRKGTLLGLLNRTETAMGARLLRQWVLQPLRQKEHIDRRLSAVEEFYTQRSRMEALREKLGQIYDIERLSSRISAGGFHARDATSLARSLSALPEIKKEIEGCQAGALRDIADQFDALEDVCDVLCRAIADDPPLSIKEGDIIRSHYHEEIDTLREAATQGKKWLSQLEERERTATGIKNLRIGYNRVFGYFIEITKSHLDKAPYRYQRKQTLANSERFITQELKELETQIVGAQDKCIALEYQVFCQLRDLLEEHIPRIQKTARHLALLDAYQSFAVVAIEYGYVRPTISEDDALEIQAGRHPVVERNEKNRFIANDTLLDNENRMLIITGPNMAGKSTYMRQVALIVLMAHLGSFVPAKSAIIPITDRIFTRVGASDDLAGGQSTFMVEMTETANILQHATNRSLLIMDEIGRGTSTFDGLSIAWAVCEYIADTDKSGAKTLFATHYHELSELEGILPGVVNYRIAVKEMGEEIVFLRKIVRGGTDKSFGIEVARLAGLPVEVVDRARQILRKLEEADLNHPKEKMVASKAQMDLFAAPAVSEARLSSVLENLRTLDIDELTPREALDMLYQLQASAQAEEA